MKAQVQKINDGINVWNQGGVLGLTLDEARALYAELGRVLGTGHNADCGCGKCTSVEKRLRRLEFERELEHETRISRGRLPKP